MKEFVIEHKMGIINGVAWVLAIAGSHWLSITDKVASASFVELVINGFLALKKKPVLDVTPEDKKEN